MKTQRVMFISIFLVVTFCLISFGAAFAGEITLELIQTSIFSRQDFGDAYTMVWSGDVKYSGGVIGEFNAQLTKTIHTGSKGYATQYDLVLFGSGSIGELLSIRTSHITTGAGSDHGVIYATSPGMKAFMGLDVKKDGDLLRILY